MDVLQVGPTSSDFMLSSDVWYHHHLHLLLCLAHLPPAAGNKHDVKFPASYKSNRAESTGHVLTRNRNSASNSRGLPQSIKVSYLHSPAFSNFTLVNILPTCFLGVRVVYSHPFNSSIPKILVFAAIMSWFSVSGLKQSRARALTWAGCQP